MVRVKPYYRRGNLFDVLDWAYKQDFVSTTTYPKKYLDSLVKKGLLQPSHINSQKGYWLTKSGLAYYKAMGGK